MTVKQDRVLRVAEVATELGVSNSHVHNEINSGNLKSFRSGSLKLVNSRDLAAYRGLSPEPGPEPEPVLTKALPPPPAPNGVKRGPGRPRKGTLDAITDAAVPPPDEPPSGAEPEPAYDWDSLSED